MLRIALLCLTIIGLNSSLYGSFAHEAAKSGNVKKMLFVLHNQPKRSTLTKDEFVFTKASAKDSSGNTPLHYAVMNGHTEMVKLLIGISGELLIIEDSDRSTPLHLAAGLYKSLEIIKLIVEKDKKYASIKNTINATLLHYAAAFSHGDILKYLLSIDKDMLYQETVNGETPFHYAVLMGNLSMVQLLLDEDKQLLYAKNNNGDLPIHLAAFIGSSEIINYFLGLDSSLLQAQTDNGASIFLKAIEGGNHLLAENLFAQDNRAYIQFGLLFDNEKNSALHYAAKVKVVTREFLGYINSLILRFPVISIKNNQEEIPLHIAITEGAIDMVKFFLQKTPEAILKGDNNDRKALDLAVLEYTHDNRQPLINLILYYPYLGNVRNEKGDTLILSAIRSGEYNLIEELCNRHKVFLLSFGAGGNSALDCAVISNNYNMVWYVVNRVPSLSTTKDGTGNTSMHIACRDGFIDACRALYDYDARLITIKNNRGLSPFMLAIEHNQQDIIAYLLSKNSLLVYEELNDSTVMHIAAEKGYTELLIYLFQNQAPLMTDQDGNTPLHRAVLTNQVNTIAALMPFLKAEFVNIKNNEGKSALDIAHENQQEEILAIYDVWLQ